MVLEGAAIDSFCSLCSVTSLCMSMCRVCVLTFKNVDLEISFFDMQVHLQKYLGQVCMSRSLGQGQGHGIKTGYTSVTNHTHSHKRSAFS